MWLIGVPMGNAESDRAAQSWLAERPFMAEERSTDPGADDTWVCRNFHVLDPLGAGPSVMRIVSIAQIF
jgi:hypothetical protein